MSYALQNVVALPFGNVIGGPLEAAIEAQALGAKATVDFIQTVGFRPQAEDAMFGGVEADMGDIRNVTFTYHVRDVDGDEQEATLTVPILTIVPIPYLRIDEMTIDFTAKITEVMTSKHTAAADTSYKSNFSLGYRSWWSPVKVGFRSSFSSKHSSTSATASRFKTELTINVNVRAVQDDIPGGLSRVLDILEASILENRVEAAGA